MRVGLVVEQFDPLRGGLEQWTYRLIGKLAQRGHEIHVVSREFSERALALPIVAHCLRHVHTPVAFAAAAEATLASLDLDVIHDMGVGWYCDIFHPHGGSWASVAARKLSLLPRWLRPLKQALNRVMPRYHEFHQLMSRQYADRGQILVAPSRLAAGDFGRFHQVAPERVRIIPNGVDTARFSPQRCARRRQPMRRLLGIDGQTVLMLIVAHNFQLKGMATLLGVLRRLREQRLPVRLLVVGGKRLQGWRRMAARLGVAAAVDFVGLVEDTLPYYAAADLYIHPTIYDSCSLVVLEAAACGLPVVTTRCNGAAELFHDGADMLLVEDPKDVEALAGNVRMLMDPATRRTLGNNARRAVLQHTFDRNVESILTLYQEVADRRGQLAGGPVVWTGRVGAAESEAAAAVRRQSAKRISRTGVLQ